MLIQAENIMRSYNSGDARIDALKGSSFSIETGEFVAITGPSGSGKTTLMNILGLLDRPTSGSLKIQGRNTESLSEMARAKTRNLDFGFVFQSYNLLPRHTAFENVELPMIYAGIRASERRKRVLKSLEDIGLAARSRHLPHQLSGGEQQRVAVARALANHPNLILADEPTGALDSQKGLRILELFQEINAAGRAVVVITHDERVARHAQRMLRMMDGEIVSDELVQDRLLADDAVISPPPVFTHGKVTTSTLRSAPLRGATISRRKIEDPGSAGAPEKPKTDAGKKTRRAGIALTVPESLKIALRALRANILRSFLTMLGIIVGVASVVSMVAFAAGAQREIAQQIRTLGANVLMIVPEWNSGGGTDSGRYEAAILRESDADAIGSIVRQIATAAPSIREDMQVVNKNKNTWVTVNGTTSNYFAVREWPLRSGRTFSEAEQSGAGKVALLGQDTATNLFSDEDPIGKTIRILSVPFKVIGILSEKGTSGSGRPQDDIVFIPIRTAQRRLFGSANMVHRGSVNYILAKATSTKSVRSAQQEITSLLRQRHRISSGGDNDFRVIDPAAMMEAQHAAKKTIGWLLAGIASVSLIVGGISIMNIMLVSVTERTREIGLRIAIGAQPRDVQLQFLMEAVLLCFLGGVIGLAIGGGAAYAVGILAGWPIYLSPVSVIGAVGLASAVGLLFGFFPARRASRLDPVAALKFE